MAIRLSSMLSQIPVDTQARVDRTRKRIGNLVREALRQETGLLLNRQDNSPIDDKQTAISVQVSLVAGLPERLKDFTFDDNLALVLEVSPYRRHLEKAKAGLDGIETLIDSLSSHERGQIVLEDREASVIQTVCLVKKLLTLIDQQDPLQKIFGVNEDILGAYIYPVGRTHFFEETAEGKVELYWGVIGLVAAMVGVSIESLTAVVLIHEVAHAYTHMGADIDGCRWANQAFAESDHSLKEGLAQYYTDLVTGMLTENKYCLF